MAKLELSVHDAEGKQTETVKVNPKVFDIKWNNDLVHQTVTIQQSNKRAPIAHTKTRADVRGGGAKPWKQKGTGRARHGSSRSPIWIGGGVTFGPRNTRNFSKKINIKAKRKALAMVLSAKLAEQKIYLVDSLDLTPVKTKTLSDYLKKHKLAGRVLIVPSANNADLKRMCKNLEKVSVARADSLNVVDTLQAGKLLMAKTSLAVIDKTLVSK
ncbi:MAG: 50S ribosomal protein L4 [bacterium]